MKTITNLMINDFKLMKLGYDFAGYSIKKKRDLSFHHMIIPHRLSKQYGIGEGYVYWNGAILVQNTSHNYLHAIEKVDYSTFLDVTSELIDINIKGYVDKTNLRHINDILNQFEIEHCGDRDSKGKLLIKEEFTRRFRDF